MFYVNWVKYSKVTKQLTKSIKGDKTYEKIDINGNVFDTLQFRIF